MIELIGWIAAVCFAICGLPQTIKCIREKNANGLSWGFLILWLLGEILMLTYVVIRLDTNAPMLFNYIGNLIMLGVMIYYKIFGVYNGTS
jgi:uncharacterized protein with PQ loop repeat